MALRTLSTPTITLNNGVFPVVPNSVSYTEGLGEQTVRVQSAGGGTVQTVYSNNVETNKGMLKFSFIPEVSNIEIMKGVKQNLSENAIEVTVSAQESGTGSGFTRSFTNMALITNYEVLLQPDGVIEVEFEGNPPV